MGHLNGAIADLDAAHEVMPLSDSHQVMRQEWRGSLVTIIEQWIHPTTVMML